MNDEELLEELRRTLRSRAEAIQPNGAMPEPVAIRAVARRWPAIAAAAALVAAVTGTVVGFAVSGSGHKGLTVVGQSSSTSPAPTAPSTLPVSTTPPTIREATFMPAGFEPLSVTFVSSQDGWVLGDTKVNGAVVVGRTSDGGATWSVAPAPPINLPNGYNDAQIRFADPQDGWLYLVDQNTGNLLWSTHNGGATWTAVTAPGQIADLEASAGTAYMVTIADGSGMRIYSTPATSDSWTVSSTLLPLGAGPVPMAQIVLQGTSGWIVENDRTVIAGAELKNGEWVDWTPPCRGSNGSASLSASSATDLVAVCEEGVWGPSNLGSNVTGEWLFASSDGGGSWSRVSQVTTSWVGAAVTTAPGDAQVVVVATNPALIATFDGGQSWGTVYSSANITGEFVGFTTDSQAVAILTGNNSSSMLMTHDGAKTWQQITF